VKNFKLVYFLTAIMIFLGQCVYSPLVMASSTKDDPRVTITSPDTISSSQLVELDVTLSGSAGTLTEDGTIQVTIPKNLVRHSADLLNNLVLGDPFYLDDPAITTDKAGNYVLNIKYDHTKIDAESAFGGTVKIKFQAPLIRSGDDTIPNQVDFDANLTQNGQNKSHDQATSKVIHATSGLPFLSKWSPRPIKNVDGVNSIVLSQDAARKNIFAIAVNYNQQTVKNAKLTDTIPDGTKLADPDTYLPATGDAGIIKHLRIVKVTGRSATGTPSAWEYVTDQFRNQISVNSKGFSVDFGDLNADDAYVVMYAESVTLPVTPTEFGVKINHAEVTSSKINRAVDLPMCLDDSSYNAVSLKKSVSQSVLTTNEGTFDYTLTLKSLSDVIKAGTNLVDDLPDGVQFIKTISKDNEYISAESTNQNQLRYKILKDIKPNITKTIKFQVKFADKSAKVGNEITNRAAFDYAGSYVYSNSAVTIIDGSAKLIKVDAENGQPLAGAKFKLVDNNGKTLLTDLVSGDNGVVESGLLAPGEYAFIETKAPNGYQLDPTPNRFKVVSGQSKIVSLKMKDFKEDSTTDTTSSTDTTSTTDTTSSSDTTSTTDTTSSSDTTSTTDTTSSTDTTSTTDTTSSSDTTSTTDTTSSSDTTSTTDTTSSSDTTSTMDTTSSTDTTSTTDTTSSSDTTSTTDTTSSSDTTSTTDTTSSSDTTSTTDTTSSTDTTSTTDTTSSTDTTSTTDTTSSSDTTSTTDTTSCTDTTSTTDTTSSTNPTTAAVISSTTSSSRKMPALTHQSKDKHNDHKKSLLPKTDEKVGWVISLAGIILLSLTAKIVFRKQN
jgi:hypothetical protein